MKEKLYVDTTGNRLWCETLDSSTKILVTQHGNVHLTEKHVAEAEPVSECFFYELIYTICPTVRVFRNSKNEYAVMLLQQDSMGSSTPTYVSLHGTFCFSEVYAYPQHSGEVRTAVLVMRTTEGIWYSYTLYQTEFTLPGEVIFRRNQMLWDSFDDIKAVYDSAEAEANGGLRNLCIEGRHDIYNSKN